MSYRDLFIAALMTVTMAFLVSISAALFSVPIAELFPRSDGKFLIVKITLTAITEDVIRLGLILAAVKHYGVKQNTFIIYFGTLIAMLEIYFQLPLALDKKWISADQGNYLIGSLYFLLKFPFHILIGMILIRLYFLKKVFVFAPILLHVIANLSSLWTSIGLFGRFSSGIGLGILISALCVFWLALQVIHKFFSTPSSASR